MENEKNGQESTEAALLELYKTELFDEIKIYWEELKQQPICTDEFCDRLDCKLPWFGNLWDFFFLERLRIISDEKNDTLNEKYTGHFDSQSILDCFPKGFRDSLDCLACELDYLFPERDYVKKFLPVLLTAYSYNRRTTGESPVSSLVNELYYDTGASIRFDRKKGLLLLRDSNITLVGDSKKSNKARHVLEIARAKYAQNLIFLTLLVNTSDICNVSASFLAFEAMKKQLHYLGNEYKSILKKLRNQNISKIIEKDPYKKDICGLAYYVISDFWHWHTGQPIYEANKAFFEQCRRELNASDVVSNTEYAEIWQKDYKDLTFIEKECIIQFYYPRVTGKTLSETFQGFASNLSKEITGKPYRDIYPLRRQKKIESVYKLDEEDLDGLI